jgi:hypothetical protein
MKVNIETFSNSTRDDGDKSGARSISYSFLQEKYHSYQRDCLGWWRRVRAEIKIPILRITGTLNHYFLLLSTERRCLYLKQYV